MPAFLAAAQPIIVKVPEVSGGASLESILVFAAGVLAAIAAVAAALITTRGASSRLEQQLANERERFDKQLSAEAERFESQLAHERYLARRSEASSSIEQTSRLLARNVSELGTLVGRYIRNSGASAEQWQNLDRRMDELLEEVNVLGLRFGNKHAVVWKLLDLVRSMRKAMPNSSEFPLDGQRKKELKNGNGGSYATECRLSGRSP